MLHREEVFFCALSISNCKTIFSVVCFFLYGGYLVLHQSLVNARRIFFVLCTSSLLAVVLFLKRLVLFHFSRVRPCEENCRWTREREGPNSRGEF